MTAEADVVVLDMDTPGGRLDITLEIMEVLNEFPGITVTYINDEAICQAAVGMMGQIGINVTLDAKPKAQHFPFIKGGDSDFYMLGWGVPTFDSHYIFNFLAHTRTGDRGSWNPTGYSDPAVDNMIVSLESETDLATRDATIGKIWDAIQTQQLYLPIHNQVLNWGMKDSINFAVQPEDQPHFQFLTFN